MILRRKFITLSAAVTASTCIEAELSAYFFRTGEEDRVLSGYSYFGRTSTENRRDWFMGQPFTHDVLFHLNPKASVLDPAMRLQLLRESKRENLFKDVLTFTFLTVFLPKTGLALSTANFLRNICLNFNSEGKMLDFLTYMEVGRASRILALVLPFATLF